MPVDRPAAAAGGRSTSAGAIRTTITGEPSSVGVRALRERRRRTSPPSRSSARIGAPYSSTSVDARAATASVTDARRRSTGRTTRAAASDAGARARRRRAPAVSRAAGRG